MTVGKEQLGRLSDRSPEGMGEPFVAPFERLVQEFHDQELFEEKAAEVAPSVFDDCRDLISNAKNVYKSGSIRTARLRTRYKGELIDVVLSFSDDHGYKSVTVVVDGENLARVDKREDEPAKPYHLTYGTMNFTYRGVVEARGVIDYLRQNPNSQ